jgi:hypothetical protein
MIQEEKWNKRYNDVNKYAELGEAAEEVDERGEISPRWSR